MIFVLAISMSACAARIHRAAVPGCDASAYVPEGCYPQAFVDHVEVRCPPPRPTTTFWCKK